MKYLILLCLCFVVVVFSQTTDADKEQAKQLKEAFKAWKALNKKGYTTAQEDLYREGVFVQNFHAIKKFNDEQNGATLAVNEFADLTQEEFATLYTGLITDEVELKAQQDLKAQNDLKDQQQKNQKAQDTPTPTPTPSATISVTVQEVPDENLILLAPPPSVDWRSKGGVTRVKDQKSCGSCWTFASAGALEGLYFVKFGKLVAFSEQNLLDCVTSSSGCNGGSMAPTFQHTAQNGGIMIETDYPYKAVKGVCAFNRTKALAVNTGYKRVAYNNATALKYALAQQPIAVAVMAAARAFQFYSSGVITANCGTALDHAVLAVGYTTINGVEAFIVKNSWGTYWGQSGYVYIGTSPTANAGAGVCGILSSAYYPV